MCCLVLILDDHRIFTVQETVTGEILRKPVGTGGFGYDPVFYLPEQQKTVAQLSSEEKQRISHRGRAGNVMRLIIDSIE